MNYVYILKSQTSGKYYIGESTNVDLRLEFHNKFGTGYTSRYRPWSLVFKKEFPDRLSAMKAERKVKSWKSRKMIEKLIKGEIEL